MRRNKILLFFLSVTTVLFCLCTTNTSAYENVMCRGSQGSKKIALTFDDGPHPRYTDKILDILSEYGIRATFFIIGVNAENYPESLIKIAEQGSEIANHTYSHKNIDSLSYSEAKREIQHCEDVIVSLVGQKPELFRPPRGRVSEDLAKITEELGYGVVLWSIDTLDWSLPPSEKISATVMNNARGGDIILMHDYVSGGNATCEALRQFIPRLLSQGYEFVTVSELMASRK